MAESECRIRRWLCALIKRSISLVEFYDTLTRKGPGRCAQMHDSAGVSPDCAVAIASPAVTVDQLDSIAE